MSHRWLALPLALLTIGPPVLAVHTPAAAAIAGATIDGSVVDDALQPVAGATVALARAGVAVATTRSDAFGHFAFANIAAGNYTVRVTASGYVATTRSITVASGATAIKLPLVVTNARTDAGTIAATNGARPSPRAQPPLPGPPPPPPSVVPQPPAFLPIAPVVQPGGINAGGSGGAAMSRGGVAAVAGQPMAQQRDAWTLVAGDESYAHFHANRFESTDESRLSTFGADVDTASYTNVRRFLSAGQRPPRDAVRIEELINYFKFDYAEPRDGAPISITTEVGDCPWAPSHRLVLVGARPATPPRRAVAGRNLVLLIDVSGSMQPAERLPMIKTALAMFVDTLGPRDMLSIVTYAGQSGVALSPTSGDRKAEIRDAIASLSANGSTNGASGLITAYRMAREAYIPGGVNRVILATDGDFNVGVTSLDELRRLITRERDSGVFLSVLGVGSGNLKDQTMQMLADRGNGNYSYLDSLQEARRVLIHEGDATLNVVAKDVKFQVEFNPDEISSWKQLGYEKRQLAARDFDDDRKDAGEMGAGHTVTVLYEVVPARGADRRTADWFTVSARYKQPEAETSALITHRGRPGTGNEYLPFAAAVAEFGLLLRDEPVNAERWSLLERRVRALRAPSDAADERSGFRELVSIAASMSRER